MRACLGTAGSAGSDLPLMIAFALALAVGLGFR